MSKTNFFNYIYKYSYLKVEDWSYIVNKYTEESRHIEISKKVNEIIFKLNKSMKLNYSSIIIKSMIFFHKYYLYNLYAKNQFFLDNSKVAIIAVACFLIATKSFDIKIRIDNILDYSYKCDVLEKNRNQKNKEELLLYENEILCVIGFNALDYKFNYAYSCNILNDIFKSLKIDIKDSSTLQKVKEYFLLFIRYSFVFPFFLNYSPRSLALGCINLLFKYLFPNRANQIWNIKEYSDIRIDIINFTNLFEQIFIRTQVNANNFNNISNNANNTNNEEKNEINFEIIRTISTNI